MFESTVRTHQNGLTTYVIAPDGEGLAEAIKAISIMAADQTISLNCGAVILDISVNSAKGCYVVNSKINDQINLKESTLPSYGHYSQLLEFPSLLLDPCELRPGSMIQIGEVQLRLPNHIPSVDPFFKLRAASTCFVFGELLALEKYLLRSGQTLDGEYCSLIDQGYHKRQSNQDVAGTRITPDGRAILLVSDGMGGYGGGDYAALCVTQSVLDQTQQGIKLESALQAAPILLSQRFEFDRLSDHFRSMGACVVGAEIEKHQASIAHIGDTRAYLIRPGDPAQLIYRSRDHSQLQDARDRGEVDDTTSRSFALRNVVNRSVMMGLPCEPTVVTLPIQEGDILILCTDGLWENLHDSEILNIAQNLSNPREIAEALHEAAMCQVMSASAPDSGVPNNDDNIGVTVYVHHR